MFGTLKLDLRLQYRYGFYYAAAFITLLWIALLFTIPKPYLQVIVPLVIFTDLGVVGFYFIAGQILFEKSERTIYALLLTPLTFREYLASKLASFSILAWIISILVVTVSYGFEVDFLLLSLGIILTSIFFLLIGVIAVLPYQSISSFIIPSQLYIIVFYLPLIDYLGWFKSILFYLIPTQGSLVLLKAAFGGAGNTSLGQLIFAVFYMLIWIVGLIKIAQGQFEKHITAGGRGGKK
jgi:fluoroquinolone transport system permease protein